MKKNLLLFDIDGILVRSKANSYDYWHEVVKKHYGIEVARKDIYMEGKTDKEILKEFLENTQMDISFSDAQFKETLDDIGSIYKRAVEKGLISISVIPNAQKILERLVEKSHIIGLVTGNTEKKAKFKLQYCGFWKYFKVGAYGDISDNRSELVSLAINQAETKFKVECSPETVFVIGDTVRDIWCAKEVGVISIAIATGAESPEILKKECPDFLFKDFNNIEQFIDVFERGR